VYGKCLQDIRAYIEVHLHTKSENALKAASACNYKHYSIIDENLVQTVHFRPSILHNTPIAIGITILELVILFFVLRLSQVSFFTALLIFFTLIIFCTLIIFHKFLIIFSEQNVYVRRLVQQNSLNWTSF